MCDWRGRDEASMPLIEMLCRAAECISARKVSISWRTRARRGSSSVSSPVVIAVCLLVLLSSLLLVSVMGFGCDCDSGPSNEMTVAGAAGLEELEMGGKWRSSFPRAALARFCCRYVRSA